MLVLRIIFLGVKYAIKSVPPAIYLMTRRYAASMSATKAKCYQALYVAFDFHEKCRRLSSA